MFWQAERYRPNAKSAVQQTVGFVELTVVAAAQGMVAARNYTSPGGTELEAPHVNVMRAIAVRSSGNEYWIHPAALAVALKRPKETKTKSRRIKIEIDGKPYRGVRLQLGVTAAVYDEASGVLLRSDLRVMPTKKDPSTFTRTVEFRGYSKVAYPWMNDAMPQWIQSVKQYRYEGDATEWTPEAPAALHEKSPLGLTCTRTAAGAQWFLARCVLDSNEPGKKPATHLRVTGRATLGFALPPGALAKLRAETVIDRNKWTQSETRVVFVGEKHGKRRVIIREDSPLYFVEWHYDLVSGGLLYERRVSRMDRTQTTYGLESVK